MTTAEKIRKARELSTEVGGINFLLRRPTALEMFELRGEGSPRRMLPFIIGWGPEVTEALIMGEGGDPHPVPFSAEICAAWLEDRDDLLWPLIGKVIRAYDDHQKSRAEASKN